MKGHFLLLISPPHHAQSLKEMQSKLKELPLRQSQAEAGSAEDGSSILEEILGGTVSISFIFYDLTPFLF